MAVSCIIATGAIGILWFILWLFVGYSSPASHPRISAKERAHIEESIAEQGSKERVTVINNVCTVVYRSIVRHAVTP